MPFLSDDWALFVRSEPGLTARTPFGYVRPLSAALLRLDWSVWGLRPAGFHLTGLVLLALSAAVLVLLVRRLTGDETLAALSGLLFALHPAHVENAGWVAARPDVLCGLLSLLSLLAYQRWRERGRGVPVLALVLFEAALLAKEAAATLPLVILLLMVAGRPGRRIASSEAARGLVPFFLLAAVHFLIVWPQAAARPTASALSGAGFAPIGRLADYASSAVFPAATEWIEAWPRLWLVASCVIVGMLLAATMRRERRYLPLLLAASAAFAILIFPALLSFQTRYEYLPSAASSVFLAALLLGAGRPARLLVVATLVAAWTLAGTDLWLSYLEAGRASERLIADLASVSRDHPGAEIVVLDLPHRVRGAPVFADFGGALRLTRGLDQPVHYAVLLDLPRLDWAGALADRGVDAVEATLEARPGPRSGIAWPKPGKPGEAVETAAIGNAIPARVRFDSRSTRVQVPATGAGSRLVCLWNGGRLFPAGPTDPRDRP